MNAAQLDEIRAVEAILGDGPEIFRDGELVDGIELVEDSNVRGIEITILLKVDLELPGTVIAIDLERAGETLGL